jgi:hypothetical protein
MKVTSSSSSEDMSTSESNSATGTALAPSMGSTEDKEEMNENDDRDEMSPGSLRLPSSWPESESGVDSHVLIIFQCSSCNL